MNFSHTPLSLCHRRPPLHRGYALPIRKRHWRSVHPSSCPMPSKPVQRAQFRLNPSQRASYFALALPRCLTLCSHQARPSSRCLPSYHCRWCRCLDEIGTETSSCYSSDLPPPGCYALFDPNGNPYPYPVGCTMPKPTFAITEPTWDVPDNHHHAAYRMEVRIRIPRFPIYIYRFTRKLSQRSSPTRPASATAGCAVLLAVPPAASPGSFHHFFPCCFRPSAFARWSLYSRLAVSPRQPSTFSCEQCISVDNVFEISSDLEAYHDNRITIDPQVQMSLSSTIDRLLTELHRMNIALLSLQSFHTFPFLCWIASVRRLHPAAR